ncbi:MAG: malate synthase A [Omnitrophica bacterium RIFCSPLOWO2_01_FULL_45_10b]|nr:MAG: malate synthase A [Omnitrophica bacterium RIFCSPLOWO2_01_FULL_45_10b]
MAEDIEIKGTISPGFSEILTTEALRFVANLARKFEATRSKLLKAREIRQNEINQGKMPDFLRETKSIRESDWNVAPIPKDLLERKVEITGPVERKMIVNALNSGAHVFMADFEDANSPTWENNIQGHINLRDAVNRKIDFVSPEGKAYKLAPKTATLVVRPRGWHLNEKHMLVDGQIVSASLFDFGLYFFHNAHALIKNGTGPYFYLPKMESHLEARLWNDVFNFSQDQLRVPKGTIRATVLIETILAAFEMDEILYELKDHSSGLNCGRWDYIFSFIKKFREKREFLLPDRAQVTMEKAFLKAYVELLIKTCHRRGIHAMGGMAAQIPIKSDAAANEAALEKVRQDKLREVKAGHDGTWVAHPGLVEVAMDIFNQHMKGPNQLQVKREEVAITAKDLLQVPNGDITEKGLRININVGILYLEAWLRGQGCVPLYNLMEDAATAEISRSQVWQWIRHEAKMINGTLITKELVKKMIQEELETIRKTIGPEQYNAGEFKRASELFEHISTKNEYPEFLTLVAYDYID